MAEKKRATVIGVLAAAFLTALKLVAGILSGSLAILAEAAHSGLDLVSAFTGYFAIRISGKPPDSEHMYGHGKADTFGGFIAALLLLITCVWIMYEGFDRLLFKFVELNIGPIAFIAMAISIAVDAERTYEFRRVAKKSGSPTMGANALHFASDIASSSAVLAGLFFVYLGYLTVDSMLAIAISVYFGFLSVRLCTETTHELLDRAPSELRKQVEEIVCKIRGVRSCDRVRIRKSGSMLFIDIVVRMNSRMPLIASDSVVSTIEETLNKRFKDTDVIVHVKPCKEEIMDKEIIDKEIIDTIKGISRVKGAIGVHSIHILSFEKEMRVDLHLELDPSVPIAEAHNIASNIENELHNFRPEITQVITHIEPAKLEKKIIKKEDKQLIEKIRQITIQNEGVKNCYNITITKVNEVKIRVSMSCTFDEHLRVDKVHEIITKVEEEIKRQFGEISDVVIHPEPEVSEHH